MIQFFDVDKSFTNNGTKSKVINTINVHVEKKDIYGIVGPTGSGKSTILRMMNGFIEADHGEIFLMGEKLDSQSKSRLVKNTSMIFQDFNLLGNLNVIKNVLLPSKLRKNDDEEAYRKAKELLNFVGLSDFEESYVKTLSGGQKQRVAIARSLMSNPKIIFCDEPTSALDEVMSLDVLRLLKKINQEFDTTLVLVSHDIAVIKSLCNKVAIIEDGRVSEELRLEPVELKPISYREALLNG